MRGSGAVACLRKPKIPEIRVPVAERRALKQAREKIRVQEEAVRLKRRLLQRREEQIKVQASRIAELENMIGLKTSAVPCVDERALQAASTVRFLEGRRYRTTVPPGCNWAIVAEPTTQAQGSWQLRQCQGLADLNRASVVRPTITGLFRVTSTKMACGE